MLFLVVVRGNSWNSTNETETTQKDTNPDHEKAKVEIDFNGNCFESKFQLHQHIS